MGIVRSIVARFTIAGELLCFFVGHRRWMLPVIIAVLLAAGLIILAQSSAFASFFYPLF